MSWATMTPEQVRAAIGGDRAKARACVAALATAAADPKCDPLAIKARMAEARAVLSPPAPFGKAGGGAAPLLLFSSGTAAFEALAAPRFFRKQIVYQGRWVHPADGSEANFPAARLEKIARETSRYLDSVGRIPFPDGHRYDSAATLGWWYSVEFDAATNSLYGVVEVTDEATRAKIGTEIRDVSMVLSPEEVDSYGRTYSDVITHVCATPYPVIPDQRNFEALELARAAGTSTAIYVPAAFARPTQEDDSMQLTKAQLKTMGLDENAKPEEIEAAIAKAFAKPAPAPVPSPAPAPAPAPSADPQVLELSRKLTAQGADLELAKKALKDRDDADLQALVDETKDAAKDAAVPTAFGKDQEDVVRALWPVDKAKARIAAKGFAQAAGQRSGAPAGARDLPNKTTTEAARARDKLDTIAAVAEQDGRRIEWSKDRSKVTVHPLMSERAQGAKSVTHEL